MEEKKEVQKDARLPALPAQHHIKVTHDTHFPRLPSPPAPSLPGFSPGRSHLLLFASPRLSPLDLIDGQRTRPTKEVGIPKPAPSRPPSLLSPPSPPSPKRIGWLHWSTLYIHEQRKQRNFHSSTIRPCAAAASAISPELSVLPSPLYLEASSLSSLFFLTSSACLSCGGGRGEGVGGKEGRGNTR